MRVGTAGATRGGRTRGDLSARAVAVPGVPARTQVLPFPLTPAPRPAPAGIAPDFPYEQRPNDEHQNSALAPVIELLERFPITRRTWYVLMGIASRLLVGPEAPPVSTNPVDPAGSWTFAAIGDFGTGSAAMAAIGQRLLETRPELVVTTGDNVYPSGRWQDYEKNIDPPHLFGNVLRQLRVMPSLGNHDIVRNDLRPYFGHFPHLQGRPYYSFTHRDAHFIALDTNERIDPGSTQLAWLERELAQSRSRWKVVYLHYPPYSSVARHQYTDIRAALEPLFQRYGVQLVLAGHEHNYERTHPIKGTTYITTGGGGALTVPIIRPRPEWSAFRWAGHHYVTVNVSPGGLIVRAHDTTGKVVDSATIPGAPVASAAAGAAQLRRRRRAR